MELSYVKVRRIPQGDWIVKLRAGCQLLNRPKAASALGGRLTIEANEVHLQIHMYSGREKGSEPQSRHALIPKKSCTGLSTSLHTWPRTRFRTYFLTSLYQLNSKCSQATADIGVHGPRTSLVSFPSLTSFLGRFENC